MLVVFVFFITQFASKTDAKTLALPHCLAGCQHAAQVDRCLFYFSYKKMLTFVVLYFLSLNFFQLHIVTEIDAKC